jgi:hypothetical protein
LANKRVVYKVDIPTVFVAQGFIEAGDYQSQFTFRIDENSPSSLNFEKGGNQHPYANVRHYIKARLTDSKHKSYLGNDKTLLVRTIPKSMEINILDKFDNEITTCCCIR